MAAKESSPKHSGRLFALGGFAFALILAMATIGASLLVDPRPWLRDLDQGPLGTRCLLAFGCATVLCLIFVPTPAISTAAGLVMGVWIAIPACVAGYAIAASVHAWIGRRLSPPRHVPARWASRQSHTVATLRLLPGLPFAATSFTLGRFSMSSGSVAIGTLVGAAPRATLYSFVGEAAKGGHPASTIWVAVISLGAIGAAGVGFGRYLLRDTSIAKLRSDLIGTRDDVAE